jgi:hypothetical protein
MISRSVAACVLFATATAGCQKLLGIGDLSLTGEDAGGVVPVVIASVGTINAPSGQAQQTKLVYATGSQRWWLFYIDGAEPKALKTKYSGDFETWTDGQALTLAEPHGGDGRNLSVAYANVNGTDVVHIVMSQRISVSDRRLYHTRATISGDTITFGAPVERFVVTAGSTSLDPDGPVTVIASDGHIADLTSWIEKVNGTGDAYVARSASADEGSSWDGVWAPEVQLEIVKFAINAHGIVGMGTGNLLAMWEDGAMEGTVSNLRWSTRNEPAGWTAPPAEVFELPQLQSVNDWAAVSRTLSDVHAVRRTTAAVDPYEHRRFDGLGWTNGQRIAPFEGKAGQGVFLASDGTSVLLATLGAGPDNSVQVIRWSEGGWGTWSAAVGLHADRSYLSGWSKVVDGRVGLIWTQPGESGLVIAGALIGL